MPHTYGVMQGRLSPPEDGRFQSFPRKSWREEFARAREAGFGYIEWIHDDYGRTANPIFSEAGLEEFDALKQRTRHCHACTLRRLVHGLPADSLHGGGAGRARAASA